MLFNMNNSLSCNNSNHMFSASAPVSNPVGLEQLGQSEQGNLQ